MTNNNENEAIGTDETSEGVRDYRNEKITIHKVHLLVLNAYIRELEKKIDTNYIDIDQLYHKAELQAYRQARFDWGMNQ